MRLFAALDVPEEVCDEIAAWWAAACVYLPVMDWRDVPRHNWHLTLAFYGDVHGSAVDGLCEALADCAANGPLQRLCTQDFGIFPRPARPRVFWAGVESAGGLKDLKHLARCCRQAGHATLRKHTSRQTPFRGHISLARAAEQAQGVDAEIWSQLPELPPMQWTVDSLSLYASQIRSQGPVYRRVESFEFERSSCPINPRRWTAP
ncbi:MAG: RNA 2',3'-cyclic phosphodiesterase [Mariprofundaceae bacterium]|nr:RNA 2',3'-cyclic phosphodiesterase [Mariprofundaceae bacterium]